MKVYGETPPDAAKFSALASHGTPFNLRVHRPQSVKVSAEGVDGSLHAIEIPWE